MTAGQIATYAPYGEPPLPHQLRLTDRDRISNPLTTHSGGRLRVGRFLGTMLALLGVGLGGGALLAYVVEQRTQILSTEAVRAVVDRIIQVESNGDARAKNPRSTATGAGQFIEATWLEMVRRHRADLMQRSEAEILELRQDAALAREMTMRFVERNAKLLRRRGLPVTPGTLYLSHFAGGAGAVALLSAAEHADAAVIMANADSTGRMSREKLVKANPFLEGVTVGGIRKWADRKMQPAGRRGGEPRVLTQSALASGR